MNEAFDEGSKIVTSFRNSKNVNRNWISFGYAMHWLRTCLTENRAKGYLNQACRVQGTGFLFSNELVKDGWKYTTLTEDRSFCTDAVVQGYRISYCEEAVFYDEQPYSLKVALRQRVRWAKGHLQSTVENCPKLLKNMFKRNGNFWITYDSFFLNFPRSVESGVRKILKYILQIYIAIATASVYGWAVGLISGYLSGKVSSWAGSILVELAVFIKYGKNIEGESAIKRLWHIFMLPFFDIIGKWSNYVALFKKVEWKAIPHDTVVDVEKLGGKREK
jgi:cellulose synthase/poly-beta-1,6-N-acetylglucosamine synthase-like glycosyltransferase